MKTAIYLRVSTNRQTQAQTIEQRLERLRKHLELQGEALRRTTFSGMTATAEPI